MRFEHRAIQSFIRRFVPVFCVVCVLLSLDGRLTAQAFTPLMPGSVDNIPQRPGEILLPGNSATQYFNEHTASATMDLSSPYDAVAVFQYGAPQDILPPNWIWGTGASMKQCEPTGGDAGGITIRTPLVGGGRL